MPYVARLFFEVTSQDLRGLSQFMGWIGQGGYYHWRVAQQGLVHLVPHLEGQPMPKTPALHPSGRPLPPRPAQTETLSMGVSGKRPKRTQTAPGGSGQGSTSSQGSKTAAPSQGSKTAAPSQGSKTATTSQGGQPSAPRQSGQLASSSGSGRPAASGGPPRPLPGNGGCGNTVWNDWYQQVMREVEGRTSGPEGPPYPIGMAEARRGAVGQIYDQVNGKAPPLHNIASEALRAYYTRGDPQTLNTWACQILCMIAEYHMACVTRGSPVTSPIVPRELAECLPPLANYTPPDD